MLRKGFRLDPDFRKLWIGQAISQIGSNITGVALPLTAVLVLNASPLQNRSVNRLEPRPR